MNSLTHGTHRVAGPVGPLAVLIASRSFFRRHTRNQVRFFPPIAREVRFSSSVTRKALRLTSGQTTSTMATPQTPRRSNRQQRIPARYGGGVLISTSQTYKWPAHSLCTRPAQPTDFLPGETPEPGETHFYSSLIRYGPPSKPIVRTYGKQRAAKAVASGSKTSETFSVGDTVLVVSTAKTMNVAVITALWKVVLKDDEGEDDDDDSSESMRIRVHWFTRPVQLGSNRQKRDCLPVSSSSF